MRPSGPTVVAPLVPLIRPGPRWGLYPQQAPQDGRVPRRGGRLGGQRRYRQIIAEVRTAMEGWQRMRPGAWPRARTRLVARLAREGLNRRMLVHALACVGAHAERFASVRYYDTQWLCALALLDQRLVEMATGEGKTQAAALAAAVAALAGTPVHLITANDYLAERDAALLRPLFSALDLTVTAVVGDGTAAREGPGYRADVVYATARTVAFDHLRDRARIAALDQDLSLRSQAPGSGPQLRGLCMAIIDEVDSILIDEAQMPLVLSQTQDDPEERARLWQALDWARRLDATADYRIETGARRVVLTEAGQAALIRDEAQYPGMGLNRGHRRELVEQALTALLAMHRDVDYMVEGDEIVIVDQITGRAAPGRIWSRGLHGLIALKEGLLPPQATATLGRTTYPRFFRRYHHLSGLSGTLREVRQELARDYGLSLFTVPLRQPGRRQVYPARVFPDRTRLFEAALERAVSLLRETGRPVLLTTDSIADTAWFGERLAEAGVDHAVLNAATAQEEARLIAEAGLGVRVTVATQMAGRGTDIALSDAVRQMGGLHVLNLQHNRSRRVDRQIAGRAARQGEPGSYEHWRCVETGLGMSHPQATGSLTGFAWPALRRAGGRRLLAAVQRLSEREDASLRRGLNRTERQVSEGLMFTRHVD